MLMTDEEHFHVSLIPSSVRSPDLTVLHLFVWGYLKERLHTNCPQKIQELKCGIWDETATINQELLCRDFDDFMNCVRQCGVDEGGDQDFIHQK